MAMKSPLYILASRPNDRTQFNNFFETEIKSVAWLLQNPGALRPMGWDLQTLDQVRIIKGEYLEVSNGDRKLIRLYEDGTLILRVAADQTFLAWGKNAEAFQQKPRLNPLALIEVTYNFVDFYAKLIPFFLRKPDKLQFRIEFQNMFLNREKVYLTPHGIQTVPWLMDDDPHTAPEENVIREILLNTNELETSIPSVAYKLVETAYVWFGLSPSEIPYTSRNEEGKRIIDPEQIKSAR